VGRPTKLTGTVEKKICDALSIGATRELAAGYAGVSYSTMMEWLKQGRDERESINKGNPPRNDDKTKAFLHFSDKVEEADNLACIGWLQVISGAAEKDPNWARWMLEIHRPKDYRPPNQTELTGANGEAIKHIVEVVYTTAKKDSDADDTPQG
jgi:hypothetical protein